jgi:hypothetical protein
VPEVKRGRPSNYTQQIAEEIVGRMAEGETLRQICRDPRMPSAATVHSWVLDDSEGFAQRYARARALLLEHWAEDMVEIADSTSLDPQDRRIKVDTRKWLLSKLKPEKYGNKLQHTGGDGESPIQHAHRAVQFTIVDPAEYRDADAGDRGCDN